MSAPRSDIYQMNIQNPHAKLPLTIPVLVLCNTPDEELEHNIKTNSARDLDWLQFADAHDGIAVLVGGGPSLEDTLGGILELISKGATVFAMNGASKYLHEKGISVDYQVIADAKPETASLVDPNAWTRLFASQVDESTIDGVEDVVLWHLGIEDMERLFPPDRVKRGGYALVGGGASVGNSATCIAYVMGFRTIHCFGYDSSHRGNDSHAYSQPMNDLIPTVDMEWAGKTYKVSVAMKAQAEKFQITAQGLKQRGCNVIVHGDGLLPAMFNTPLGDLAERDKYRLMWQMGSYREVSPGEHAADEFLKLVDPDSLVIDFGCGTGRGSLEIAKAGHDVILVDFADNCRDHEAVELPFLEWDLTIPCPISANYGFCTDVMEHIPTEDVEKVVKNIMASAATVYFQISTVVDMFGDVIGQRLHHTVKSHDWWLNLFVSLGNEVKWQAERENASCFIVKRAPSEGKY